MNTLWSSRIQSADMLYLSRSLRFSDTFREMYIAAFRLPEACDILEVGCGPGAYAMDERALPLAMEARGFCAVSTAYLALNLTPDNPDCPREAALMMFEAERRNDLDVAGFAQAVAGDLATPEEFERLRQTVNARYGRRVALYGAGARQWDVNVALTQVTRGTKEIYK